MWHAEVFCRLIEEKIINRDLLMHMRTLCEKLSHVQEGVAKVHFTPPDGAEWTEDDLKWIVPFLEICNKERDPLTILGEIAALTDQVERLEFLLTHAEITIEWLENFVSETPESKLVTNKLMEHLVGPDGVLDYNNIRPKGEPCSTLKKEPPDPGTNPSNSG